jgi:hypothetical protein
MNVHRTAPSETLRRAIVTDGRPLRRIAAQANVPASSICRFIHDRKRGLSLSAFDRVASVIGCELRPEAPTA